MAAAAKKVTSKRPKRPRRFSPRKKPRKTQEGSNPPPRASAGKQVGRKKHACDVCRKMKTKCLLGRGDICERSGLKAMKVEAEMPAQAVAKDAYMEWVDEKLAELREKLEF